MAPLPPAHSVADVGVLGGPLGFRKANAVALPSGFADRGTADCFAASAWLVVAGDAGPASPSPRPPAAAVLVLLLRLMFPQLLALLLLTGWPSLRRTSVADLDVVGGS
jgi:hypothetical protein